MLKVIILLLCTSVLGYKPECSERSALIRLKRPTYEFSVRILDRVAQETGGHFVFSPLSTWLQLLALADGAQGKTLNEILKVTKYHRMQCFRKRVRDIFNDLDEELSPVVKHRSVIVIDRLLDVKDSYVTEIEKLRTAKVISTNFKNNIESAAKANEIIELDVNGVITEGLDAQDFNMSVLLMTDVSHLKADWWSPFNPADTRRETFYTNEKTPNGFVNMMQQTAYFNITYVPFIKAKALELPFNSRLTMILLLPNKGKALNLFWTLKDIRLMTIFSLFKTNGMKLVNVKMPRFNITTDIGNMPELVYDMGVQRIFYPHLANLNNLSDYKTFVSLMGNVAYIEVTEKGVTANDVPQLLMNREKPVEFVLNRPFAYLIVDRTTELILFAGVYTNPSYY